jgi:SWI/SNF-related matrix-associated actin-dependent regulator 1 of chromatin subfamily A
MPPQFTQVLDILKTVLDYKGYHYLLLTGSTAVDERQGLVDEFNEDDNCKVFLLSTKAGMLFPVQL